MIVYGNGDGDGRPLPIGDLHFANNLVLHNETGILGDGVGIGNAAIVAYMRRETIRHNIIAGGDASRYPRDNFFLRSRSWTRSSWTGAADYRLKPSSPYVSAATTATPSVPGWRLCAENMPRSPFPSDLSTGRRSSQPRRQWRERARS